MIKNIVFDMGRVLISYDIDEIIASVGITRPDEVQIIKDVIFSSREWQEYDRGTVNKTVYFWLIDTLPELLRERAIDMLFRTNLVESFMPARPDICEIARELKQNGYSLWLLSNAGHDFHTYSRGVPALQYFDGCFVSSDYQLLKPEPQIYSKFFEVFKLKPEECIFIDDMPANCEGAEAQNMRALCFNNSFQSAQDLRRMLSDAGIKISL